MVQRHFSKPKETERVVSPSNIKRPDEVQINFGNMISDKKIVRAVNCELGKEGAGCLTNLCTAVAGCLSSSEFITIGVEGSGADYETDGVDDDVQINLALSELGADGGNIFLLPGTYTISDTILFDKDDTSFIGFGRSSLIKLKANAGFTTGQPMMQTKRGAYLSNVMFDGNKASNTYGVGIYVYESPRSSFDNLTLDNIPEDAILSDGTGSSTSSHANQYSTIKILDAGGRGIFMKTYSYDCQFVDVWIGRCNVGIRDESGSCLFTDVHIWESIGNNVELRAPHTKMIGGYNEKAGLSGIDIFGSTPNFYGYGTIISGVDFRLNGRAGVNISQGHENVITGCTFYDNNSGGITNGSGVLISGTSYDNTITGCFFKDDRTPKKQAYGVRTLGTTSRTLVSGCNTRSANHLTGSLSMGGTGDLYTGLNIE